MQPPPRCSALWGELNSWYTKTIHSIKQLTPRAVRFGWLTISKLTLASYQLSAVVSSLPGPAAPFPSADTSWAQKDYAGTAWTRVVYSTSRRLLPPSLRTLPTWRQQHPTEREMTQVRNMQPWRFLWAQHLSFTAVANYWVEVCGLSLQLPGVTLTNRRQEVCLWGKKAETSAQSRRNRTESLLSPFRNDLTPDLITLHSLTIPTGFILADFVSGLILH